MNIGQILWLGGYNKKLNQYNKFGFIRDIASSKELYVNVNNIYLNSEIYYYYKENGDFIDSDEFESDYVCYILEQDTNYLKDVRLCREVQWNDYSIETTKTSIDLIENQQLKNLIIKQCKDLFMENEKFFDALDVTIRFQLCVETLNENKINIEYIMRKLHSVFLYIKNKDLDIVPYYNKLSNDMKTSGTFFKYLDSAKIFEMLWQTEFHGMNYWWDFNNETKIKYIYRLCYLYEERNVLISNVSKQVLDKILFNETNKLVQGLFYILAMKYNRNYEYFLEGHKLIQEYVIQEICNQKKVNLYGITPLCNKKECKVELCEGKTWRKSDRIELHFVSFPTEDIRNSLKVKGFSWDKYKKVWYTNDTIASRNVIYNLTGKQYIEQFSTYCPRIGKGCEKNLICKVNYYDFNQKMDWKYWNILNMINDIGFEPQTGEKYNPKEYVYKLNAWINRLIEISDRLKCSKCRQVMKSNFEYSKALTAVYNNTIAYCPLFDGDEKKHNGNTYFNHCNGCGKIIDSRESTIKQEDTGYYLCTHCGRGKKNHPSFREGDKCPKCGVLNMYSVDNCIYICNCCGHRIKTPRY